MKENIETDIKIALDRFLDNKDINSAIFIVEQFILGNYILIGGRRKIPKECLRYILSDYKRVLKENEELKEKENKIYKEVQESLSFEKFLIAKDREPDLFNQGRFYISQIVYDILNGVESPEGIHKENKHIRDIAYIPIQKVKEKIEKYKNMCISNAKGYENYFKDNYDELVFRRMEQLEKELLESEE